MHYAGVAAAMDQIMAIADRHGLVVLEDAAQGMHAAWKGRPLDSFGAFAAFSYHETKNVIAGEGGAPVVNDRPPRPAPKSSGKKHQSGTVPTRRKWRNTPGSHRLFLSSERDHGGVPARPTRSWTGDHGGTPGGGHRHHAALEKLEQAAGRDGRSFRPNAPTTATSTIVLANDGAARERALKLLAARYNAVMHYVPLDSSPAGKRFGRARARSADRRGLQPTHPLAAAPTAGQCLPGPGDRSHRRGAGWLAAPGRAAHRHHPVQLPAVAGLFRPASVGDEVILLDRAYTRRDWRNRIRVKTEAGCTWLTIPVEVKGRYHQAIDETLVSDPGWADAPSDHRARVPTRAALCRRGGLDRGAAGEVADEKHLTRINETLLRAIGLRLGLAMVFRRCTDLLDREATRTMDPTERLARLAEAAGAERYLSGPAAKVYLDPSVFASRGISVDWMSYDDIRSSPALGGFEPQARSSICCSTPVTKRRDTWTAWSNPDPAQEQRCLTSRSIRRVQRMKAALRDALKTHPAGRSSMSAAAAAACPNCSGRRLERHRADFRARRSPSPQELVHHIDSGAYRLHEGDVHDLPADLPKVDLAISYMVVEHVADDVGFVRKLAGFVVPGAA